jgi:hypothetical protein
MSSSLTTLDAISAGEGRLCIDEGDEVGEVEGGDEVEGDDGGETTGEASSARGGLDDRDGTAFGSNGVDEAD